MSENKTMGAAQRAYEEKRARKAGKSLDAHLADKAKREAEEAKAKAPPAPTAPPKKPGLLRRFLDRAHKPL